MRKIDSKELSFFSHLEKPETYGIINLHEKNQKLEIAVASSRIAATLLHGCHSTHSV